MAKRESKFFEFVELSEDGAEFTSLKQFGSAVEQFVFILIDIL